MNVTQARKRRDVLKVHPAVDAFRNRSTARPESRFSVIVDKRPGCRIVFQTRLREEDAHLIVVRLAAIGCPALVVPMHPIDAPGLQRRSR